jgi:histidyl-tRNA synthetase
MGDVVLGELLRDRGLMPGAQAGIDYWVAGAEEGLLATVMRVAARLRDRGLSVEYALRPQKLQRQMKTATSANASKVFIIHDERRATIRRLSDGLEREVSLSALLDRADDARRDPWNLDESA